MKVSVVAHVSHVWLVYCMCVLEITDTNVLLKWVMKWTKRKDGRRMNQGDRSDLTFVLSSTTLSPSAETHSTAFTVFFPLCHSRQMEQLIKSPVTKLNTTVNVVTVLFNASCSCMSTSYYDKKPRLHWSVVMQCYDLHLPNKWGSAWQVKSGGAGRGKNCASWHRASFLLRRAPGRANNTQHVPG